MGNCCLNPAAQNMVPNPTSEPEYQKHQVIHIYEKDKFDRIIGSQGVKFELLAPIHQETLVAGAAKIPVRVTGCVIPGLDPRGEINKECQDIYTFFQKEDTILAVLFDGHGKEGQKIAKFCKDYMVTFFTENFSKFGENPIDAITEMVQECDECLKISGITTNLSGATAVVAVISPTGIHAGSVGDSRAILATLPRESAIIRPQNVTHKVSSKWSHKVNPMRTLSPVTITVDQKPNHSEELKRITASGGIVEKITDDSGNPVGPYRVWLKKGNYPGLAMSRSIGDTIAHEIGVSSTPICNSFELYPECDQFIVLASDGLWDVMDNQEVTNFVEKYRSTAKHFPSDEYPAKNSNSTIARLLCEEARYRWFGVVEDEDVMIDDISVIVIEFTSVEPLAIAEKSPRNERNVKKFNSISFESELKKQKTIVRNDPHRGSITKGEEHNEILEAAIEVMREEEEEGDDTK